MAHYNNNAVLIKRQLLVSIIKLLLEDKLEDEVDRIPYEMTKGADYESIRCCVYHDRSILKTRILARLGFSIEDYIEDGSSLVPQVRKALKRKKIEGPILTVLDEACNACIKTQYLITDACQGCLARPCTMNCPKKAISFSRNRADIDKAKCINCGICLQACPYHAIIKIPVPCEEACPVDAIAKDNDGKERIDFTKCVFCGNCIRTCPFGAMMDKSQIVDVINAMKSGKKLSAMIAPAIAGQFRATLEKLVGALKQAGFDEVYEVALGADITARKEAEEFAERMERDESFMTTSCCPSYIEMVKKHLPDLKSHVSNTRTPMHYTAEIAKKDHPDYGRVFIGPCLAKRKEGIDDPLIDYVLTAEEIGALFTAMDINVMEAEDGIAAGGNARKEGRSFPWSGGVAEAVKLNLKAISQFKSVPASGRGKNDSKTVLVDVMSSFEPVRIDGFTKEGVQTLKDWSLGYNTGTILEVMACPGGCISGPMVIANPKIALNQVKKLAEEGSHE
ncbi:monomeric [FeFe] hydrogenase [Leadbettera azotonutricia]|nr:monomeric [FeFe] hydrogenase [Leadbettera azotonutricia]AEF82393.1 Fe-hydrogenase large subunit family protein [Leadbettera azotonutricia ZAS-9]